MKIHVVTAAVLLLALLCGAGEKVSGQHSWMPLNAPVVEIDGIRWAVQELPDKGTCWIWPEVQKDPNSPTGNGLVRKAKMPKHVIIPSEVEVELPKEGKVKLRVLTTFWSAFEGCDELEEVTIPESFTEISGHSFKKCKNLRKVHIGRLQKIRIGENAFRGCTSLASIDLPFGTLSIKSGAFDGSGLTSIAIPGTVDTIYTFAFENCTALKEVYLMHGVRNIQQGAFSTYGNLDAITIPSSVKTIGSEDFINGGRAGSVVGESGIKAVYLLADMDNVEHSVRPFSDVSTGFELYVHEGVKDKIKSADWAAGLDIKECYKVTFKDGDEVFYEQLVPVDAPEKKAKTPPCTPAKEGREFAHWVFEGQAYDFTADVTKDITLQAKYEGKSRVTFDANGGTLEGKTAWEIETEDKVEDPGTPEHPDKRAFKYWVEKGSITAFDFTKTVVRDIALQALWATYKVTLNANGGVLADGVDREQVLAFDQSTSKPADPTKKVPARKAVDEQTAPGATEDAQFLGWAKTSASGIYEFGQVETSDVTLTAQWDKYILTFDADGGSFACPSMQVAAGEAPDILKAGLPTKEGYRFVQWTYKGEPFVFSAHPMHSDVTVKAEYRIVPRIAKIEVVGKGVLEEMVKVVEKSVEEGKPVTITVDDKVKDRLAKIEVIYRENNEDKTIVVDPKADPLTFLMPAAVVTLRVSFSDAVNPVESRLLAKSSVVTNPVSQVLVLQNVAEADRVEVYSLLGVLQHAQAVRGADQVAVDVRDWANGVYLVRLVARDGDRSLRVVVSR